MQQILKAFQDSINVKQQILNDTVFLSRIDEVIRVVTQAFKDGKKVLFCGNGGSAADAQHLAAEFSGRFYYDRPALPSEALHCNTSYITAVGNDYSYDEIYARIIRGSGVEKGDILIGLSTSGNSANVVKAFQAARDKGVVTIGMTGASGGQMKEYSDYLINVPSTDTPRIQESHMLIGHTICQIVEANIFPRD